MFVISIRRRVPVILILLFWLISPGFVHARDLHVDPANGDDAHDGISQPVKTFNRVLRLAEAGDTIHLLPIVYHDWFGIFDKSGEPGKPIVIDGHGATLDGCDRLDPTGWHEVSPGLFRHDDLCPLTDAIIARWFFLWDGEMNRMHRCSKGPSEPLKAPNDLAPGEWTFVKDESREARPGYIHGSFYIRLPKGQSLDDADIHIPYRVAGVLIHGDSRHWIVKNITSIHPYNDGFNLSDCRDIEFENIRAIDCGDDGISAHGNCQYRVKGLTSIGNATGICDTGSSRTRYENVYIRDCEGFDLFFLNNGRYSLKNAVVLSSAAKSLYLQGDENPISPCDCSLENVLFRRVKGLNEVRVSPNCRLTAKRCTFLNLDLQATGGDVDLEECYLGGWVDDETPRAMRVHLWPDATWRGQRNVYVFESLRLGQETFTAETFERFRERTDSDFESRWMSVEPAALEESGIGADMTSLKSLMEANVVP
ncbi:MAG: right-handed parallel beta-helix repeat-containing protein [Planctomycetota bacterium]|nr:right-handed parallel beta-helix repeat-containing protein [Planctomycetota bacterium]MDA1211587.1 right-handed parallel beta-helix repeat-containing protein [Planctomycetota bacterium]